MTSMSRCGSEFQRRRTESTEPGKLPASFFLMEVRFVEYFSMAQGRHAVVSRRSLPEVPRAHSVCPRPERRSGKTRSSIGRKTCVDLPAGELRTSGRLYRRGRLALSETTG